MRCAAEQGSARELTPSLQELLLAEPAPLAATPRGEDILKATVADQEGLQKVLQAVALFDMGLQAKCASSNLWLLTRMLGVI